MIAFIKKEFSAKISILIFAVFSLWWIILHFGGDSISPLQKEYFSATYGVLALWGGYWGMKISRYWGGAKSVMGKAILFFSLGLLLQELGQLAYSAYTFLWHVEIPYPSLGDLGYFGSIPAYILGVYYLAKASGVQISLKSYAKKIQAFIIPLVILSLSYFIFLRGYEFDWQQPLVVLLDLGYPLGQAMYISMAALTYLLSKKVLGGVMKGKVLLILLALAIQYVADYMFLYKVNAGTWETAGFNEYIYLSAYLFMTLSLIRLKTLYDVLKK